MRLRRALTSHYWPLLAAGISYAVLVILVLGNELRPEWLWSSYCDIFCPILAALGIVAIAISLVRSRSRSAGRRILLVAALLPALAVGGAWARYEIQTFSPNEDGQVFTFEQHDPEKLHVAVLGDPGRGSATEEQIGSLLGQINGENPLDAACLLGDNLYGHQPFQDAVRDRIVSPLKPLYDAGVPVHAVIGSHDYKGGYARQETEDSRFGMKKDRYYILRTKDDLCSFFMIDSEKFPHDPVQYRWLMKELRQTSTKWNVLVCYGPPEASPAMHGSDGNLSRITHEFFQNGTLSLSLSGKNHFYERRTRPGSSAAFVTVGSSGKVDNPEFTDSDPHREAAYWDNGAFVTVEITINQITVDATDCLGTPIDHVEVK
ncbi:metallophosphoesterase [bacterium]|nr:metallophosphoesterase [bacterium]